jgi:hypothetical protein
MRTKEEVKQLIQLRVAELQGEGKKKSKRLDNYLLLYRTSLLYLESDPTEGFVNKQYEYVNKRIAWIEKLCQERKLATTKDETEYKNSFGMVELNNQLKYLKFLLNK